MKKLVLFVLLLPALVWAQSGAFGHGGSSLDLSTLLPIIADSSMWTDGSHVHAIKPKDGKSIEADSGKFGALHVTGNTTLDGNLTMNTIATEQVKLGTGSDAAPELSSVGDVNTGIRFPGSDVTTFVQGGTEKVRISANGNVTLGSTGAYNMLGLVNAASGHGTGIGITTTAFNKRIDSYAQFADTSSIRAFVDGTGEPHISLVSKPRTTQDTLGIYSKDGSWYINAKGSNINVGGNGAYFSFSSYTFMPPTDDNYYLAGIAQRFKKAYFTDSLYVAGKGQGATIIWGQARKIGDVADSAGVLDMNGGSPRIRMMNADGSEGLSYNAGSVAYWDSLGYHREKSVVADDGTITLATGVAGWGEVMAGDNEQWAHFRFTSAGVVTLIANSALVSKTASAGDDSLMVYDGGDGVVIKNRLGGTKKVAVNVMYFAP